MTTETVHVVQYNILSPALSEPRHYPRSPPKVLDERARFDAVWEQLLPHISERRSVICLQEVAQRWYGPLHDRLAEHGYQLVVSLYGNRFNDFMGVALAYPTSEFTSSNTRVVHVGGQLPRAARAPPSRSLPARLWAWLLALFAWLLAFAVRLVGYVRPSLQKAYDDWKFDPWEHARGRSNTALLTTLTSTRSGKSLAVATYHFPCAYWSPETMTLHTIAVGQLVRNYAKGAPVVFCTDANFVPSSPQYRIITQSSAALTPDAEPSYPARPDVRHQPAFPPFDSAYHAVNGREPPFTNHSWQDRSEKPFTETLDYVFYAGPIVPVAVSSLPSVAPPNYYPSEDQPSDHLLLAASFHLLKSE